MKEYITQLGRVRKLEKHAGKIKQQAWINFERFVKAHWTWGIYSVNVVISQFYLDDGTVHF